MMKVNSSIPSIVTVMSSSKFNLDRDRIVKIIWLVSVLLFTSWISNRTQVLQEEPPSSRILKSKFEIAYMLDTHHNRWLNKVT